MGRTENKRSVIAAVKDAGAAIEVGNSNAAITNASATNKSTSKKRASTTTRPFQNTTKVTPSEGNTECTTTESTTDNVDAHDAAGGDKTDQSDNEVTIIASMPKIKFKVLSPPYDDGFLTDNYEVVSCKQLLNRYDDPVDRVQENSDEWETAKDLVLWGCLIGMDPPPADKKKDFMFTKSMRNKKFKANSQTYNRALKFADLRDSGRGTFVILEHTNTETNQLWMRDLSYAKVRVGERFVVLSPKCVGALKSGSRLVHTDRPLELLVGPTLPYRALNPNKAKHELKYFIIKDKKIRPLLHEPPIPWRTSCNGWSCDRLKFGVNRNAQCGCFMQSSRNDNASKNVVVKFDFEFNDDVGGTTVVRNFTSLRTSQLFFEKEQIHVDYDQLSGGSIYRLFKKKFYRTLRYVNNNGGWTMIGWYIRAQKEDEDMEEDEEHLLHGNIKINVAYLYPSLAKQSTFPSDCYLTEDETEEIQNQEESAHSATQQPGAYLA